jgi:hypothetical protein
MPFSPDEVLLADQQDQAAQASQTDAINTEVNRRYKTALAAGAPLRDRAALLAGISDSVRRESGIAPTYQGAADTVEPDSMSSAYRVATSPIVGGFDSALAVGEAIQGAGNLVTGSDANAFRDARDNLAHVNAATRPEDQGFAAQAGETIGQSIGQTLLPGGVAARGTAALLPAGMSAARRLLITQAATGVGAAAPQLRPNYEQAVASGLTPAEAALYAGGQLATEGVFTAAGGRVATGLGLDVGAETLAGVRQAAQAPLNALPTLGRRAAGIAVEGALEEPGTEAAQILQDRAAGMGSDDPNADLHRLALAAAAGVGGATIGAIHEGVHPTSTETDDLARALAGGDVIPRPATDGLLAPIPAVSTPDGSVAAGINEQAAGGREEAALGDPDRLILDAGRTQQQMANDKAFQIEQQAPPLPTIRDFERDMADDIVRQRDAQGYEALGQETQLRRERADANVALAESQLAAGNPLPPAVQAARAQREQIAASQAEAAAQALKDADLVKQRARDQIEGDRQLAVVEQSNEAARVRRAAMVEAQRSTPEAMADELAALPTPGERVKRLNELALAPAVRQRVTQLAGERIRKGAPNALAAPAPTPVALPVPSADRMVAKSAGVSPTAPQVDGQPATAQPPATTSTDAPVVSQAPRRERLKTLLAGKAFQNAKVQDHGEDGVRWVLPSGKTVDFRIVADMGKIHEGSWLDSVTEGGRNKAAVRSVVASASAAEVAAGRPAIPVVNSAAEFRKLLPADKARVMAHAPAIAATSDVSGKQVGFSPQTLIRFVEGRGETEDAAEEERNHAAVGALLPPSDIRLLQQEDPQLAKLNPTSSAFLEAVWGKYKTWRDARDAKAREAVSPTISGVWTRLKNAAKDLLARWTKASPGAAARTTHEVFEDVYTGNVGQRTGEPNRMTATDDTVEAPGYAVTRPVPEDDRWAGDAVDGATFDSLLTDWRKAHGNNMPVRNSTEWKKLVNQARQVDAANGKSYSTSTAAAAFTQATREQVQPATAETTAQWETEAQQLRKSNPRFVDNLAERIVTGTLEPGRNGRIALSDREQTALAQEIETQFAKTERNFTQANAMHLARLAYADDIAGTAWGRAGVARQRGMLKTEDGRKQMMLKPVFSMSEYTRRELAKAEEVGDKARIQQLENAHFAKVTRVVERMKASTGIDLLDPRLGATFSDAYSVGNVMRLAEAATAVSDKHYNLGDWTRAFWRQGLLSFPATAVVNIGSNFVNAVMRASVRQIASAGRGDFGVLGSYYAGFLKGMPAAAKNAMASFMAGEDVLSAEERARSGITAETKKGPQIPVLYGLSIRPAAAGDSFIKTLAAYATVGAEAHRLATGTKEQKAVALANAMRDPTSNPEAWAAAMVEARKTTFQDLFDKDQGGSQSDLTNPVRGLNLLVNGEPTGLAGLVLPFVSTPTAITRQATDYIPPLKVARMLRKRFRGGYAGTDNQELSQDVAQLAIGSLITAAVMALAGDEDDPAITGTQSDNAAEFSGEYEGRRPPSYAMKLFGKWYSYRDLGPLGTAMASMTDVARAAAHGDHIGVESISKALRGLTSGSILDSLLPVVGMLGDAVSKGDVGNSLENYAARTVGNFLVPAIVRGSVNAMRADGDKRRGIDKLPNAAEAAAGEKSPTFGRRVKQAAGIETAADVLTVWGDNAPGQRIDTTGDLAMRFFRALPLGYKPNQYDLAIEKFNATQPDKSTRLSLSGWDPKIKVDGVMRTMTIDEYAQHVKTAGGYFKKLADAADIDVENPSALDMKKLGDARKLAGSLARDETKKALENDPTLDLQRRFNAWKIAHPGDGVSDARKTANERAATRLSAYMTAAEGGTKTHPKQRAIAENYRTLLDAQLKTAGF